MGFLSAAVKRTRPHLHSNPAKNSQPESNYEETFYEENTQ